MKSMQYVITRLDNGQQVQWTEENGVLLGISAGKAEDDCGDGADTHDEWVVKIAYD